jgi:MerR family transcriptional regulator, redox-sensitive transcriptional activator SoxR
MSSMTIGRVADRVGIAASAIRYYESEGLLPPAPRVGGKRRFDEVAITRLQVVHTARELGFSLDEIRRLLTDYPTDTPPPERWRELAREKLPRIDEQVRRALALRRLLVDGMRCGCVRIEDCFLDGCRPAAGAGLPVVPHG